MSISGWSDAFIRSRDVKRASVEIFRHANYNFFVHCSRECQAFLLLSPSPAGRTQGCVLGQRGVHVAGPGLTVNKVHSFCRAFVTDGVGISFRGQGSPSGSSRTSLRTLPLRPSCPALFRAPHLFEEGGAEGAVMREAAAGFLNSHFGLHFIFVTVDND